MIKAENILKGTLILGAISLLSYTGGQASAPYLADEYVEIKNELWKHKQALAGVIKKVLKLDSEVKELKVRVNELEKARVQTAPSLSSADGRLCVIRASWLRVRKCPSLKCEVLGILRKGTEVVYLKTLQTDIKWRKVGEPLKGYLSAKYCK